MRKGLDGFVLPPRMDYGRVFRVALRTVVEDYDAGRFELIMEADLRSWLFRACVAELERLGHPPPLPIHAEKPLRWGRRRPDLQLGPGPAEAVELKLQTTKGDSIFLKATGGKNSVQTDLQKVRDYARRGTTGHFVLVEVDDGTTKDYYWRKTIPEAWIPKSEWSEGSRLAWAYHSVPAAPELDRR